jgi:flagellar operon protein
MRVDDAAAAARVVPGAVNAPGRLPAGAGSFADTLKAAGGDVQLSRHAQKRVDRRELNLDAGRMQRLSTAIASAAQKGARNSVVMLDGLAVVVNVRDRTVVTAMDTAAKEGGHQRVFTNVDSVVIA